MSSALRGDLLVLKPRCHRHLSHRGLPAHGGGCGEPQAGACKPGRMAWCPRPAPLGTDLCRETFCRGCGGSRRPGEHGLQGREQRDELSTGGGWGPAQPPPPCLGSPVCAHPQPQAAAALRPQLRHLSRGARIFGGILLGNGMGAASRPRLCPSRGSSPASPTPILTSELRKDRKGIREFEGLVSANREHVSQGPGSPPRP